MRSGIAYIRVSSESQVDNYSIPTQTEGIRKYAKEHDIEILREFTEPGVTGKTLARPALTEMRGVIATGKVEVLICYEQDRLSRHFINLIILANEFEKAGTSLAFVIEGEVGDSPQERMLFGMRGIFAEYEREMIAERTGRGKRARLESGKLLGGCSSGLYGYRYVCGNGTGEGTRYPDKKESEIVNQIYQWYLEGGTLKGIATRLTTMGETTPSGQYRWNRSSVFNILRNKAYLGTATFSGIEVKYDPLIDIEIFEQVQARFQRNKVLSKRNSKGEFLLSGYIVCDLCGRRYSGATSNGRRYYYCTGSSKRNSIDPCPAKVVKADYIEGLIWEAVSKAYSNPPFIAALNLNQDTTDYEAEMNTISVNLKRLEKQQDTAWKAYIVTDDMPMFEKQVKPIKDMIADEQRRYANFEMLKEAADTAPKIDDIEATCKHIRGNIGNAPYDDKRILFEFMKLRVRIGDKIRLESVLPVETSSGELGLCHFGNAMARKAKPDCVSVYHHK